MDFSKELQQLAKIEQENELKPLSQTNDEKSVQDSLSAAKGNIINNNSGYKSAVNALAQEQLANELKAEAIKTLSDKQKNELNAYILKQEKRIQKQVADSEIMAKKVESAKKRYGYLYYIEAKTIDEAGRETILKDENGQPIFVMDMKAFTPNRTVNRFREIANIYKNLNEDTRRIIKATIKTLLWVGVIAIAGVLIWQAFEWLIAKGVFIN